MCLALRDVSQIKQSWTHIRSIASLQGCADCLTLLEVPAVGDAELKIPKFLIHLLVSMKKWK